MYNDINIQYASNNIQYWTKHLQIFHFLARFLFTTSDTELDYYHKKKRVRVASRVPERLKP